MLQNQLLLVLPCELVLVPVHRIPTLCCYQVPTDPFVVLPSQVLVHFQDSKDHIADLDLLFLLQHKSRQGESHFIAVWILKQGLKFVSSCVVQSSETVPLAEALGQVLHGFQLQEGSFEQLSQFPLNIAIAQPLFLIFKLPPHFPLNNSDGLIILHVVKEQPLQHIFTPINSLF